MFYHDHSWGITRLNVYAGEAAGYTITDDTEKKLVEQRGSPGRRRHPAADRPGPHVRAGRSKDAVDARQRQSARTPRGTPGAGAPRAASGTTTSTCRRRTRATPRGMSAYGRWMYGPWFWPPATGRSTDRSPTRTTTPAATSTTRDLAVPDRPVLRAGADPGHAEHLARAWSSSTTPRSSTGSPTRSSTLQPKTYRLRLLNAANDRFFNFQWYTADPTQGDGTTRGRPQAGRARGRADRPDGVTDPGGRRQRRRRPRLGADRHRGRIPARAGRHRRPAAHHVDHRPDPLRRRQRRPALAAARAGGARRRDRGLLEVRGQDADPLQRRARRVPGASAVSTTTTPAPRTSARPAPRPSTPATAPTPAPSCR